MSSALREEKAGLRGGLEELLWFPRESGLVPEDNQCVRNLMEGDSGAHQAFGTLVSQEVSLPVQGSIREEQQLVLYREQELLNLREGKTPFH